MKNRRIDGLKKVGVFSKKKKKKKVEGSKRNIMETTKNKNTPSPHSQ